MSNDTAARPTAWAGMVIFSGVMLMLLGGFQAVEGIVAIVKDDYYLTNSSGLVITVDYDVWGWTHLGIGILGAIAGIGVFLGQTWARVVGIGLASVSAFGNLMFLPAFPIWATIIIALDVLIIYALAVHGREVR